MLYLLLLIIFLKPIVAQTDGSDPMVINILGGNVVDIGKFPYVARLENSKGLLCGASILTQHHVLTAVNCILFAKEPIIVHTGTPTLSNKGSVHHIEANYTYGSRADANIAVLRVKEPIIFDKYRQPIKLFKQREEPKANEMAIVAGWGYTEHKHVSNQLQAVQVPIVSRSECKKLYSQTFIEITSGLICAGYSQKGHKDSCKGDGGGPLVIKGRQAGIVSKGSGCGRKHFPGIYTNIAFFSNWIAKQILK